MMRFDAAELGPALLFCPGDRSERFPKAAAAADTVVLDLEDGVASGAKDAARDAVVAYCRQSGGTVVRINHPTTDRGLADATALVEAGCRILLLPKTELASEVAAVRQAAPGAQLIVTVETARGVLALPDILAQSGVAAVSWGPYDLAADIGLGSVRDGGGRLLPPLEFARNHVLICAAAARRVAFDTVTTELGDPAVLVRDATEAAVLGFAGKFCIHPRQVNPIRRSFQPPQAEVERCRRLLAAVPEYGAFLFEGEMIDEPMLRRARRILARAAPYSVDFGDQRAAAGGERLVGFGTGRDGKGGQIVVRAV